MFVCPTKLCPLFDRTGKEEEFPKKPLGQLPPEPAAAVVVNHMANGQSHAQPAEPPRDPSPLPEQQRDSRPPSRARRDSLDKLKKKDARSRGSGEIGAADHRKQPSASTSAITTPERAVTLSPGPAPTSSVDGGRPQSHATANHNSNAASSSRRDITPRWVKPSDTKLEAVKAAAARETQLSRAGSPAGSSPDESVLPNRRPRSRGFVPGSNRGSNASQYDNVPGLPEQDFEVLELERPPSRMRTPRSETSFSTPSLRQLSPSRTPSLAGSMVSVAAGPRLPRQPIPPLSLNSPAGLQPNYPSVHAQYHHTPPQQYSPGGPTVMPLYHPSSYSVSLEHRGDERHYTPPSRVPPPSGVAYGDRPYATTDRHPNSVSPEKALMNNSYATYRSRQPLVSAHEPRNPGPGPERVLQLESPSSTTPVYLRQPTRLTSSAQVYSQAEYRYEPGHRQNYAPEGGPAPPWGLEGELPPRSPGGMPRSPSFQKAQMTPVQEFTFPSDTDGLLHYRTQFQEQQPVIRQQLFGGPHYRQAQEAFAMQESMLL